MLFTFIWFALGGMITSIFSGSLFLLSRDVSFAEVLTVGMIVPCFTWFVHLSASFLYLPPGERDFYWRELGWICFWGSVALLPAAAINLIANNPSGWWSVANVLASVALMAVILSRDCAAHGLSREWPVSWVLTISLNMAIFALSSRHWW